MKKLTGVLLGVVFLFASLGLVAAQDSQDDMKPPKVLVLYREYTKPGHAGTPHEKTEAPFVQAFTKAKWPTHYFAADSLSGRPRTLFFMGYSSFADWEKDHVMIMKNTALSAELDRYALADGDQLSDTDQSVLIYNEGQSLNPNVDIAHMRGFEISLYRVKAGHRKEWTELVKLVQSAYGKVPDMHWATFELAYGQQEGATYVIFSAFKGGADLDKEDDQNKQFMDAMGEDGMKKLGELESSAVESSQTNLFVFNPAISYPPDAWVKADPEFWGKPKAAKPMAGKKMEEKPAAKMQ
jgi:hypothetical protein